MKKTRNIAAQAGRWSAQNPKKAIFGWLAFVIASVVIGGMVGTEQLDQQETGVGESGQAQKAVFDAFPEKAEESVLVQSASVEASSPRFRAVVGDVVERLERTEGVRNVEGPYSGSAAGVSTDGKSALVSFEIPGDEEETEVLIDGSLAAVAEVASAHPEFRVEQSGDGSVAKAVDGSSDDDFQKAEFTSLPLTLVILVIAFGTLAAAGIPVLLAISAVAATIGLIGPLSQIAPVTDGIASVILLIGLAVGVDYSLFYLRREREERAAGRSAEAALEAAAATSGRAVLISGFTVMIALGGMYLAGGSTFSSFATGTIAVVAIAMIGSLTVLPAILSKLGDRVEKGRVPLLGRTKARIASIGLWSRVIDRVLRRPLLSALISGGLLVALAVPALSMHTTIPGSETFSRDLAVMQTYDRIQEAFPSESVPATVVVEAADVTAAPVANAIGELEAATAERKDLFEGPPTVEVSEDRGLASVSIPGAGNGTDAASQRVLDALREDLVPAAFGGLEGAEANVTGETAITRDFNDSMSEHIPYVFAFVLSAAFLLLLFTFRSIVIAVKAIVLNLLSVGAAYGLLVLVFQEGWGEGLLGFESNGAIVAWLPLFLFVVLFGLSMDYHVFILTRVREAFDGGMSTADAVSHAIKGTAGVVTSAAVVMVGVFSIFATLSSLDVKQMGVGLAAAILIDATIIRGVLLPATMTLLGDWNWWLPKSLERLPRIEHEPAPEPSRA
ncbi:MAG: MMPL family transporter [Actinomycetota bacterium]|nr:MMPL family transporter [Actinomycetota bacterium]